MERQQIDNSKTTSELIADNVRHAITTGEFQTGEILRQDDLAKQYSVSKIPIREALYQLKSEGLVSFQNNRGSIVSGLSVSEVEEIYTMRIALEEIALKRAIEKLETKDLIQAESILKLIDASTEAIEWAALNWQFHACLYGAASMPKLIATVEMLHNNVSRYLILYLADLDYQKLSQEEHWTLLDACKKRDKKHATRILKTHLQHASKQTQAFIKEKGS